MDSWETFVLANSDTSSGECGTVGQLLRQDFLPESMPLHLPNDEKIPTQEPVIDALSKGLYYSLS